MAAVCVQTSRGQRCVHLCGPGRPRASPHLAEEWQGSDAWTQREADQQQQVGHVMVICTQSEDGDDMRHSHSHSVIL